MRYGVPYMGSKNKIAPQIIDFLPAGEVLVDLFAGGGAITHAALLSGKYKRIIANDTSDIIQLFADAAAGKYRNRTEWISREEWHLLKDADPFVKYIWSFGNIGVTYLYGEDIEEYKHLLHNVYTAESLAACKKAVRAMLKSIGQYAAVIAKQGGGEALLQNLTAFQRLRGLESLQRLQRLRGLEILQRLQRLRGLEISRRDYAEVEIPAGAVVYCDIPYNTKASCDKRTYSNAFDFDRFYSWALSLDFPVYVSEYSMPEGFTEVWSIAKFNTLSPTLNKAVSEKIFVQSRFAAQMLAENFPLFPEEAASLVP
ncbi:MAG: DNA adenine methylase [Clostridia bacterium]|nr:DNA adenine methylase [Lentisphaeria bacterium]MBR0422962.1 DNA adenine methylase [Clostridia bacterium]